MHQITPACGGLLYSVSATREAEHRMAAPLPAHTLMQRAGRATARLALALAPHARHIWVACGSGNNGGDGFEAAVWLHHAGKAVTLTWTGTDAGKAFPADAQASMERALAAGLAIAEAPPADFDFCIDALLGIGMNGTRSRSPVFTPHAAKLAQCLERIRNAAAPVLAVDVPSGLDADTGTDCADALAENRGESPPKPRTAPVNTGPRYTLALLTLKPGLFTAAGRDLAGEVWLDTLRQAGDADPDTSSQPAPTARLAGPGNAAPTSLARRAAAHASHKGSFGDVAVIGGETRGGASMAGAALLAARAALHAGAGRVMVSLLGEASTRTDPCQPELMFRALDALDLQRQAVVCGCGGGQAIAEVLHRVLSSAPAGIFDADALNAVAADNMLASLLAARGSRRFRTVLTPHPLEAARLLGCSVADVQRDRLAAADRLARQFQCTVVLKGSGTVIATPGRLALINPTGNALLATAGTGDVLGGMVGAGLARGLSAEDAAEAAVFAHGDIADRWASRHPGEVLTASGLAQAARLC